MTAYWKAILAAVGTLCVALGTAAMDGGISLSEALLAVGGTIASSGLVAIGPKNTPKG